MKIQSSNRWRGFTLIELLFMIVVIAILIAIFLPQLNRRRVSRLGCVNNLKQIGLSFRIWVQDAGDRFPMKVFVQEGGAKELIETGAVWSAFLVMSNELSTPKVLVCPQDRARTSAASWKSLNNSNVSYFVCLEADESNPQMFLSGDDNLAIGGAPAKSGLLALPTNSPVSWMPNRHKGAGNIGLADGSVQAEVSNQRLRHLLFQTGEATNRLVFP
jgi:prepilin-type processing-associated H-X9-DG protein